ncbi:hypothetical protein ACFQGX_16250 [Nonomuraea dietziae]|uniref:hypothetical protein n=1 Tax=Nonomuraea dietziae TaxID=65515 RepID=UPI0036238B06
MTPLEMRFAQPGDLPTLQILGGEDVVWDHMEVLEGSPVWFRVAETLLAEWDTLRHPEKAAKLITEALRRTNSAAAVDDVLDQVCDHFGYLQRADSSLASLALDRSRQHDSPLVAELAGMFLEAAMRLTLAGVGSRYGVLARLVDRDAVSAPAAYSRRVVRLLGIAYEHWRDTDLLEALRGFLGTAVHGDASYELAMCHISDAFNASERPELMRSFACAHGHLRAAIEGDEDRPDASAYLAAIEAVLAFEAGRTDVLSNASKKLRRHITEHTMWLTRARNRWADGRYDMEAAWYDLSIDLEEASFFLDQPLTVWPTRTVQHILAVYTAHRAVRIGPERESAPGLQFLIAPRIEGAFVRRDGLLLHLRAMLAEPSPNWNADAAEELRAAVEAHLHLGVPPPGVDDSGKAHVAARFPRLAAAIGDPLLAPSEAMLGEMERQLADREVEIAADLPVAQQAIYNEIISALEECPDFQGVVRQGFVRLTTQLIRFLANRTNRGRAHHAPRFAYLFAPAPGGKLPLESELQEDLQDYLDGNLEDVDIEVWDRSGGRADIVVRFPGFEIVIECKRTKGKTTREGLRRYLGQTVAYQAGGVTLGVLAILDLRPKPDWIPNIRDSMWADRIQAPEPSQRDRWAVVVRVPGNRVTPHDM